MWHECVLSKLSEKKRKRSHCLCRCWIRGQEGCGLTVWGVMLVGQRGLCAPCSGAPRLCPFLHKTWVQQPPWLLAWLCPQGQQLAEGRGEGRGEDPSAPRAGTAPGALETPRMAGSSPGGMSRGSLALSVRRWPARGVGCCRAVFGSKWWHSGATQQGADGHLETTPHLPESVTPACPSSHGPAGQGTRSKHSLGRKVRTGLARVPSEQAAGGSQTGTPVSGMEGGIVCARVSR